MSLSHRHYFNSLAQTWEGGPWSGDLSLYLREFGIAAGHRVLDVGAGTGQLTAILLQMVGCDGQVIAADISDAMLLRARKNNPQAFCTCTDACELGFTGNIFDKIVCFAAFPHIVHPLHALKEMHRVLKPGGRLLILHMTCSRKLNQFHAGLDGVVCHDQLPRAEAMQSSVHSAGFQIVKLVEKPDLYWVEVMKP
jgi:ubiquinone/menaquinone biosynthesis C-methylase UbiE